MSKDLVYYIVFGEGISEQKGHDKLRASFLMYEKGSGDIHALSQQLSPFEIREFLPILKRSFISQKVHKNSRISRVSPVIQDVNFLAPEEVSSW